MRHADGHGLAVSTGHELLHYPVLSEIPVCDDPITTHIYVVVAQTHWS